MNLPTESSPSPGLWRRNLIRGASKSISSSSQGAIVDLCFLKCEWRGLQRITVSMCTFRMCCICGKLFLLEKAAFCLPVFILAARYINENMGPASYSLMLCTVWRRPNYQQTFLFLFPLRPYLWRKSLRDYPVCGRDSTSSCGHRTYGKYVCSVSNHIWSMAYLKFFLHTRACIYRYKVAHA